LKNPASAYHPNAPRDVTTPAQSGRLYQPNSQRSTAQTHEPLSDALRSLSIYRESHLLTLYPQQELEHLAN
ncbi:hypothetical protein, partial [Escherichia coli]|uniref:hypothetical protein n=1 Tax=Escherichia coli TaxID=562 RepID=UPI001BDD9575